MSILVNICTVDLMVFVLLGFELFISVLTDTIEEASGYVSPQVFTIDDENFLAYNKVGPLGC